MSNLNRAPTSTYDPIGHSHVFLGTGHEGNERKTWAVIALCGVMMVLEIGGGALFGSVALIADGMHMSTHAAAMLIAALAYTFARRHANDSRFGFGTGKFGDLAGFSSAVILSMVALLIGYEAVERLFVPEPINFNEAIPIAVLGLAVNIVSAWLLSGGDHGHSHGHSHGHEHDHGHGHEAHSDELHAPLRLDTGHGVLRLELFEKGIPGRFRLHFEGARRWTVAEMPRLEIERPDGSHRLFSLVDRGDYLESTEDVPEPHEFTVRLRLPHDDHAHDHTVVFTADGHRLAQTGHDADHDHHDHGHGEHNHAHNHGDDHGHDHDQSHDHGHDHGTEHGGATVKVTEKMQRDNNMRAAFVHVAADAGVSVLVIIGLSAGKFLGWTFMDPVMGLVGAAVIANWSYTLIRDTGGILLDMTPDAGLAGKLRAAVEQEGDRLADLHLWRLGPGHLGAIVSIVSDRPQAAEFYRCRLGAFPLLSHLTIEVRAR